MTNTDDMKAVYYDNKSWYVIATKRFGLKLLLVLARDVDRNNEAREKVSKGELGIFSSERIAEARRWEVWWVK